MSRYAKTVLFCALPCLSVTLVGCNQPFSKQSENGFEAAAPLQINEPTRAASREADTADTDTALAAVVGASEIPYTVYPNGKQYRVGGENGLKIVVFQTDDEFEVVDNFYRQIREDTGMPRLMAMQDYVRYSDASSDSDPWANDKPGIVIHKFKDPVERKAVGAGPSARTNIIMSF